ncbi:MAG: hypothetical protein RR235_09405 [Oscillospiraceae bacterium]
MINFNNYAKEIEAVQEYRNHNGGGVSLSDAFDMFRADIIAGQALPYNTGDALPGFDFAAAKAEWEDMTKAERDSAVIGFQK